uniref:Uncharacterized protein MANES_02G043800 n=1 Tax=Rhizophora mucronata TaxID=61149 RepID=A0A2P2J6Z6_RHIMU
MSCDMSNVAPRLELEAFQTVVPINVTNPRQTRRVSVTGAEGPGIFHGCLNVVLYYNKAKSEDSGWVVAGWFKESLQRCLAEQPLLSGRLRIVEDGKGQPEIVSNDSGVRLVEAKIPMTLQEFLDVKGKQKLEAELVFWKEVDEQDPQFSPLLYVQASDIDPLFFLSSFFLLGPLGNIKILLA